MVHPTIKRQSSTDQSCTVLNKDRTDKVSFLTRSATTVACQNQPPQTTTFRNQLPTIAALSLRALSYISTYYEFKLRLHVKGMAYFQF
jgi:hypothetical protein